MKRIHIIHEKYSDQLQNTHRKKLAKYLKYIGFDNLAQTIYPQVQNIDSVLLHLCMYIQMCMKYT